MGKHEVVDTEPTGFLEQSIKERIAAEVKELKAYAESFGVDRIKDGSWFLEFIGTMLKTYSETILKNGGVSYFYNKYPGLPREQIANKLIEIAEKYAAISGGVTALGATSATLGTAGVGIAGAVGAVGVDILFTTRLQLRLIYDLSVLYGYPIDPNDPEDLLRAFSIAYGVTVASAGSQAITKFGPEVVRHQLRSILWGNTKAIQSVARKVIGPRLGAKITNQALMKGLVPGVSIVISTSWNYVATKKLAEIARHELRAQARIRDTVQKTAQALKGHLDFAPLVFECICAVATCDGSFNCHEEEIFNTVVKYLDLPKEILSQHEEHFDVSPDTIEKKLLLVSDATLKNAIANCLLLVAASDGLVKPEEEELLSRLFNVLGESFDRDALQEKADYFKRPKSFMDTAGSAISSTAEKTKEAISNIGGGIKSLFGRKCMEPALPIPPECITVFDPIAEIRRLSELHTMGILTDDEFKIKKIDLLARI